MKGAVSNITDGEDHTKCERQQQSVEDEFVGAVALASAKSPRNRRSHTRAHPAVGGLQNEHHKWKSERGAGEGIGADATKKVAVEDDDANERE